VLIANWQSGIGVLESLLAPLFTVGISLHLENLIVRSLKRREDVTSRYLAALTTFETALADPTKHPDYLPLLRQEVWQRLMQLPTNRQFTDAPTPLKHAAVRREMARDTWAYEPDPMSDAQNAPTPLDGARTGILESVEGDAVENPLSLPTGHMNGKSRHNADAG